MRASEASTSRRRQRPRVELLQRTLMVQQCLASAGVSPGYRSGLEYRASVELHGRLTESLVNRFDAEFHLYPRDEPKEEEHNPGALISSRGSLQFVAHAPSRQFDRVLLMALSGRLLRMEFVVRKPRYGSALMVSWSCEAAERST